jgi:hypothetical protein
MKFMLTIPVLTVALISGNAMAEGNTVAGALIGGAAGAAIGHHMHGRDGAIVGGALGAAVGTSIANKPRTTTTASAEIRRDSDYDRDEYIYRDDDDDYRHRERVVYEQPVVYERPVVHERVVYVQPRPVVVYRPVKQVVRYEYADYGRHYSYKDHRKGEHKYWKERAKHARKHHRDHDHDHGRGRDRH